MGICHRARWVALRVAHTWLYPLRNLLDMDTFSKSDPGGWWGWAGGTVWRGVAAWLCSSLRSGGPLRAGLGEQRVEGGECGPSCQVPGEDPSPVLGVLPPLVPPLLANPQLG